MYGRQTLDYAKFVNILASLLYHTDTWRLFLILHYIQEHNRIPTCEDLLLEYDTNNERRGPRDEEMGDDVLSGENRMEPKEHMLKMRREEMAREKAY